jgi:hypothetical protein
LELEKDLLGDGRTVRVLSQEVTADCELEQGEMPGKIQSWSGRHELVGRGSVRVKFYRNYHEFFQLAGKFCGQFVVDE